MNRSNECLENTAQEKVTPIARLIAWLGRVGGKPPLAPKDHPPSGTVVSGRMGGREIHRKILLRVMHNLSEEYYGAGWIVGLEHYLWHMALRQSTEEGQILLYCAETSGGWECFRTKCRFISRRKTITRSSCNGFGYQKRHS